MKFTVKRALLLTLVTSVMMMGSNCTGSVSVGASYPGAWGYGPYGGPYRGGYGGVYVGTSVPIW